MQRPTLKQSLLNLKPDLEKHFGMPLEWGGEGPDYLVYRTGDFFKPHRDNEEYPPAPNSRVLRRRVAVILFLNRHSRENRENCFGGGLLNFYGLLDGRKWKNCAFGLEPEPGLLVAFPSSAVHEVTPITFGERYSDLNRISCPSGVSGIACPMINKIVVLGGGSAGFLSALAINARLPQLDVTILRSPDIGIIGVGEGTTISVPDHLHCNLQIDPGDLHRNIKATWKLGIKFLWGPRPYFNYTFSPQFNFQYQTLPKPNGFYAVRNVEFANAASSLMTLDKAFARDRNGMPVLTHNHAAYHLENIDFVTYLEAKARERGVRVVDDRVLSVDQNENGIQAVQCQSGSRVQADLWIDCSGFSSYLLEKTLNVPFISFKRSLFCDRAVVGGWERGPDEVIKPYTTAETMNSGWCWQIEHDHRINRGYVYSSAFISDAEAEEEFRRKNPKVGPYAGGSIYQRVPRARLGKERGGDRELRRIRRASGKHLAHGDLR